MNPTTLPQLKASWFKKQEELPLKKKRRIRRYLHFDKPIPKPSKKELKQITNPDLIAKRAFFPLIKLPISSRVYRKDPTSKVKTVEWKERPISYASHSDSLVYSWYTHQLEYFYEQRLKEEGLQDVVIAYRKFETPKSNIDFALEIFEFIKERPESSALALDIKGFYDNLDHSLVKKAWRTNLGVTDLPKDHYAVYKSITRYAYVRFREIFKALKIGVKDFKKSSLFFDVDTLANLRLVKKIKTNDSLKKQNNYGNNVGIPQGTPISCILSNIYMFDFDKAVQEKVKSIDGLYRRYSDDIIIVCSKGDIEEIESFVQEKINDIHLQIQKAKTEIRHFTHDKQGKLICLNERNRPSKLQYLGVELLGEKVILRHRGYAKFERKMKNKIVIKLVKAGKYKIPLFKRKIYEKYSPLGKDNYFSYIKSATAKLKKGSFEVIAKQTGMQRIMRKINNKIEKEKK